MITRLTVTGFKSFAQRTTIELSSGLTAVVGPNGSGKSNLADAVRWVLGEQSKARLRLDERDDIIFAGADGRPRSGSAEVELVLAGLPEAVMQGRAELAIKRQLYRDGGSQYWLSGAPVKFSELQALMAAAGISAGGYSVIGQGAIDALVLATPAERKSLFADAAGIREPELSRATAWRQLEQTTQNCQRLTDIVAELEPRLKSLGRQVASHEGVTALQDQIVRLRQDLVTSRAVQAQADHVAAQERLRHLGRQQTERATALAEAQEQLESIRHHKQRAAIARDRLEASIAASLAQQRQQLAVVHEAQLKIETGKLQETQVAEARLTRSAVEKKLKQALELLEALENDQTATSEASARAAATVADTAKAVAAAQDMLKALRRSQAEGTRDQYVNHALEIMRSLASSLHKQEMAPEQVRLMVHKAGRLLSHAAHRQPAEVAAQLQQAQQTLEAAMHRRETASEHQTNITITLRSREIDIKHQRSLVASYQAEIESLTATIQEAPPASQREVLERHYQKAGERLAELDQQLAKLRTSLAEPSSTDTDIEAETAVTCAQIEHELASLREQAISTETDRVKAETALADAHHLAKSWNLSIPSLTSVQTSPDADPATVAAALAAAEAKLDALAGMSDGQLAEYHEVKDRHDKLVSQISDLTAAGADLEGLIKRLDGLIRRRFQQNFGVLAERFTYYCGQLLPGATGQLKLKAEGTDYGVDISVAPRGKRPVGIQALSGGERSLAGIALLGAILSTNPSPFVVLDEIDAALDEANSGHVAAMLAELATTTQLIIVTHNRQTMQAAQTLYGVTLTGNHLSTVLSLRLEQATALAAR